MSKSKLIEHLRDDIYCRLGVSKISGIGVIAIKDIPKGTDPFKNLCDIKDKIITVYDDDLKEIDPNVVKILKDFFGNNNRYDVLYDGPNNINISYYLNHSIKPNVDTVNTGSGGYYKFITNTSIKEGTELTINYKNYEI